MPLVPPLLLLLLLRCDQSRYENRPEGHSQQQCRWLAGRATVDWTGPGCPRGWEIQPVGNAEQGLGPEVLNAAFCLDRGQCWGCTIGIALGLVPSSRCAVSPLTSSLSCNSAVYIPSIVCKAQHGGAHRSSQVVAVCAYRNAAGRCGTLRLRKP